jgi:hypothetical protein
LNNLSKAETKEKITKLLDAGESKTEIFKTMSGGEVKDRTLAYMIASYVNPFVADQHSGKVNVLITIMFIQALVAALIGYGIGIKFWPNSVWIVTALMAAIPLCILYGFYKNNVGAYNAYIALSLTQPGNLLKGFAAAPIATSISLAIALGIVCFVWHVRSLLFPDFAFVTPKKVKGNYVFSS